MHCFLYLPYLDFIYGLTQFHFYSLFVNSATDNSYNVLGKYVATIEHRDGIHFVRVYLNWRNEEALLKAQLPVRTRIASVTPGLFQIEI